MSHTDSRARRLTIKRGIALVLCAIAVPIIFQRMDEAYVIPQRLKQVIRIMDVETTMDDTWWRARIQMSHRGFQPCDVELTIRWLDKDGDEVGRGQSLRTISPGDTVIVRMAVKAAKGKQAVDHQFDYSVKPAS